jgi:hypothetical protein
MHIDNKYRSKSFCSSFVSTDDRCTSIKDIDLNPLAYNTSMMFVYKSAAKVMRTIFSVR